MKVYQNALDVRRMSFGGDDGDTIISSLSSSIFKWAFYLKDKKNVVDHRIEM